MTLADIVEDEILQALERGVDLPNYFTVRVDDLTPLEIMPETEILVVVADINVRVVLESLLDINAEEFSQ